MNIIQLIFFTFRSLYSPNDCSQADDSYKAISVLATAKAGVCGGRRRGIYEARCGFYGFGLLFAPHARLVAIGIFYGSRKKLYNQSVIGELQ
jgi:hypothetical protein